MQSHTSLMNYKRYHCLHLQVRKFQTTSKPNKALKYIEVYISLLFGGGEEGRGRRRGMGAYRSRICCCAQHNTEFQSPSQDRSLAAFSSFVRLKYDVQCRLLIQFHSVLLTHFYVQSFTLFCISILIWPFLLQY